jgi:hypothetical protein
MALRRTSFRMYRIPSCFCQRDSSVRSSRKVFVNVCLYC